MGSTSGWIHTGLDCSPIFPRGERPLNTQQTTPHLKGLTSQAPTMLRTAYPLVRCSGEDWLVLLLPSLSASCVQQGKELQREEVVEASES